MVKLVGTPHGWGIWVPDENGGQTFHRVDVSVLMDKIYELRKALREIVGVAATADIEVLK